MLGVLALLACQTSEPQPEQDCPYSCEELLPRYEATLARCGLDASDYPLECTAVTAERLSCQVDCLSEAECSVFEMRDPYMDDPWTGEYGLCSVTCPSAVW